MTGNDFRLGIKSWEQTVKMRICYKSSMSDMAELLRATSSVEEFLQGIRFYITSHPGLHGLRDQLLARFHAEPQMTAAKQFKVWLSAMRER